MTKKDELLQKLEAVKNSIKILQAENKIEEAHAKLEDVKSLKKAIEVEEALENEEIKEIENKGVDRMKIENEAQILRAMVKEINNKVLSAEEVEALAPYKISNAITGEEYILPQDISTKITKRVRELKSFRDILGHKTTTALTGSFPVDATPDLELVDVEDGIEMTDSNNLEFAQVKFALKKKGALIALNNTVLAFSDNDLVNFVVEIFVKRAINTYNKMAVTILKTGKTTKALTGAKALAKSIRTDIDPAMLAEAVIATNQLGYDKLVGEVDGQLVSYMQADISQAPVLAVNKVPVIVFSERALPTVVGKAPVFYGNLKAGAMFVDAGKYSFATDSSAGFTKNVVYTKVIDYIDCVQVDSGDSCYMVGELTIS